MAKPVLQSMMMNADSGYHYRIHILHTNISGTMQRKVLKMANKHFTISFENVTAYLDSLSHKLPLRDYYSKTTYYRLFIAEMFPGYDKVIYIDSDTVVQGDISRLYLTNIGDHYVGACHEQVLAEGNCLLVYPEQSMWWNYRKPKPMKLGAFDMALKNDVPVVPCFITMRDTEKLGADGFPVQEYTPHLGQPIWPDKTLPRATAKEKMKQQNEEFCRRIYEREYGIPLAYSHIAG